MTQTDYIDRLMQLSSSARDYSPRMREIHEVAMRARGLDEKRRMERHANAERRARTFIQLQRDEMAQRRAKRGMQ